MPPLGAPKGWAEGRGEGEGHPVPENYPVLLTDHKQVVSGVRNGIQFIILVTLWIQSLLW